MTTRRAPYIKRSWTETELAAQRSMGDADARSIGQKLHRSFMVPGQGEETEDKLALHEDTVMRESPSREDDLMIATMSGLLAWIITLALRTAFGG
jgi:hypothetical protein